MWSASAGRHGKRQPPGGSADFSPCPLSRRRCRPVSLNAVRFSSCPTRSTSLHYSSTAFMSLQSDPQPSRLDPARASSTAHYLPSIGPASTPDIFSVPPPIHSDQLSSALFRRNAQAKKTWDCGEWSGRPPAGAVGAEGSWEGEDEGVEWRGWMMLIGSVTAWVFGVWSLVVGPFVDTSGVWVSPKFDLRACCLASACSSSTLPSAAARHASQGHTLQVSACVPRARDAVRCDHQLVGTQGQSWPPSQARTSSRSPAELLPVSTQIFRHA